MSNAEWAQYVVSVCNLVHDCPHGIPLVVDRGRLLNYSLQAKLRLPGSKTDEMINNHCSDTSNMESPQICICTLLKGAPDAEPLRDDRSLWTPISASSSPKRQFSLSLRISEYIATMQGNMISQNYWKMMYCHMICVFPVKVCKRVSMHLRHLKHCI